MSKNYFHVYNRGVEKRNIFLDEPDRFRFVLGMAGFNDTRPIFNLRRFKENLKRTQQIIKRCEPIVEIICYTLMPNHYHILLRETRVNGVSKFMQKLGIGYTKYFNKRYKRTGVLFQGGFKAKLITNDEYLLHLSRYIHLNALTLTQSDWLKNGVMDKKKAYVFLNKYRWHSLPYWIDKGPCLIKLYPGIILGQFSSLKNYEKFLLGWRRRDFNRIREISIEEL